MAKRKDKQTAKGQAPKDKQNQKAPAKADKQPAKAKQPDKAKQPAKAKQPDKAKKAAKEDKGPGLIPKTKQFFREVRTELKKVTWPSRKETIASTSVVLVLVFLVAVYLGLVDVVLSRTVKLLLQ
jgi:preprotein translocase subunit SecE